MQLEKNTKSSDKRMRIQTPTATTDVMFSKGTIFLCNAKKNIGVAVKMR